MKKKLTKFLSMALLIVVFASIFPQNAHALSNDVHDILFDWEYYYKNNSDVAKAIGKNQAALRNHYEQYGKREGRPPSILFNPKYYLKTQTDVKKAFGNDYVAAYNHFVNHGINEGRPGSESFNVSIYKSNYEDLRKAYGNNNLLYLKHYREYGINEKRNATSKIKSNPSNDTSNGQLIADGYYTIQTGKYGLNVQYAPTSGIGNMVLDPVNGETNEIFYIQYIKAHKAYYITPYYRSSVAINALYGASCQSGSQVKAHPSNTNDTASLWYITQDGNNIYRFQNVACKMYITVNGNATTGTALVMKKKQSSNQTFALNKTSTPTETPSNNQIQSTMTNVLYNINTNSSKITCGFDGYKTTDGRHEGIDFKYGYGKKVYSLTDGVVINVVKGSNSSSGLSTISIYQKATNKTIIYLHTAPLSSLKVGQTVTKGTQIATESWRGMSSSSSTHTHVEVRDGKKMKAAKSQKDYTLENSNPTPFWNNLGYSVK